ncbi:tyrosine-type recombinase/integrase [Limibacillus halophilus]|uniref:Integrase n=1 Tax=Limibacillus halophilus TaxID=1579333 RepID=A0A839SWL9_9PROT|nr:site-specific integrase [Limibacillus halophilus]MBB3065353.1 integrase [Limibacillus halophilus]
MPKLTKRTVDALQVKDKDYFLWDSELPGFGVRVMPSGRKGYLIQYRDDGRRTRRKGLGKHGVVTADEARTEARLQLAAISQGSNPAEEKRRRAMASTVDTLCELFMRDHVTHRCKPSTQKEYRRNIDLFIIPALGRCKVEDVTRAQVAALHARYHDKPYQANRTLGVLSIMFNLAEVWGLRPDGSNPCRHVRKYAEKKRERFLNSNELERLGATLTELEASGEESQAAIDAIRLLILTGCRLGEIQTLKWEYIQGDSIWLPDSKTGAKRVYLGGAALEVLGAIKRLPDNPYVIAGTKPGAHLTDMQKPWRRIRAKAGLPDLRIHDLRHSFASSAVGMGESLPMIGKLLGHSQVQTTARYAHLADDPMKAAADRVSAKISISMTPRRHR